MQNDILNTLPIEKLNLNILDNLRYELGMDSNSFWPMIFTIVPFIAVRIYSFFNKAKEKRERKMFELYCKSESDNFYFYVMLVELSVILLSFLIFFFFYNMIENTSFLSEKQLANVEFIITGITSFLVTIIIIFKMNWIRKRLLGDKEGKRIVLCSIFLINIAFVCGMINGKIEYIGYLFMALYILLEIRGLLHFWGRYTRYDYSSMKLHLDNGDIIVCEDIEKVIRKKDYISVETEGRNIILQYNKIWEVEYYGEPKFILKKYWHP